MAEVTLSKYCEEAKELIRSESYDHAIGICRHILKHYPKYLRAYRLLGEACLEKEDYVEAANFFKRVLGADMEDMVVYVGLGIIFNEQSALDEAIWQLERAFDLSPGNAEIRGELQRLYGDRDGAPPPKLKLTSAALGRLYLREELYQRAIDEFKGVLQEDLERPDVQIALAQALWWSDQRQEAAKVCEEMLETYPNCLKANLILGEILLASGRQEEGTALLDTARAMDPENVVAQQLFREESPLSPERVTVPRLDETGLEKEIEDIRTEMPSPVGGTEPGEETAPDRTREAAEEAMPDWLRSLQEEERELVGEELPSPPDSQVLPDWLQQLAHDTAAEGVEAQEPAEQSEAGADEGTVARGPEGILPPGMEITAGAIAAIEGSRSPEEEPSETPPVEESWQVEPGEDMPSPQEPPDWLSESSMESTFTDDESPRAEGDEEETPEWLGDLREVEIEDELAPEPDAQVPAWLRDLTPGTPQEEAEIDEVEAAAREAAPEEVVPREESEPEVDIVAAGQPPEIVVEETLAAVEEPPSIGEETMEHLRATMPDESDSIEEIMAWMEESKALLADEGVTDTTIAEELEAISRDAEGIEEGEVPAWLQQLSPTPEAGEEGLVGEQVEEPSREAAVPTPEEDIPTWLLELRPETADSVAPAMVEETGEPPGEEPEAQQEDKSALLEEASLEEAETVAEQEPTTADEERVPTWLLRLRAETAEGEAPTPSEEPEMPPEEKVEPEVVPSIEAEADVKAPTVPPLGDDEMPPWLRELREEALRDKTPAPVEEPEPITDEPAAPPVEEEEMPSWLSQLQAEAVGDETILPTEEAPLEPGEPEPHEVEAEFPSWLQEVRAEVAREREYISPEEVSTGPEIGGLAPTEVGEDLTTEEPEIPPGEVPAAPLEEEVPSWLRELRTQAAEGDTGILMRAAESASQDVQLPPLDEEELPSWLQQLRAEAEEHAGVGPAAEPALPVEDLSIEEPAPWPEEEAEQLTEPYDPAPTLEEPAIHVPVAEREEPSVVPPMEETVAVTPQPGWTVEDFVDYLDANPRDGAARLDLARLYSAEEDLDRAAQHYELMLSHGSLVEGVKDDLESLADRAPDHLPTHELLADAYMRTGDLQKALDKYRWLKDVLAG